MASETGTVFNIQRFSTHDGPGIQTTVFLKGCNLRCVWCHNPEGLRRAPELQLFPAKCIACGRCLDACPVSAHRLSDGQKTFARELCLACGRCAGECFSGALRIVGSTMSVDEVLAEVLEDRAYYENSGGGVTFSGGESLLSVRFLTALLREAKQRGVHTAVDTAGNIRWSDLAGVLELTDLLLYDFKHIDAEAHEQFVGTGNERIIENLKRAAASHPRVWVRIPVVPGFNADEPTLIRMAEFLEALAPIERVELLPFHRLGEEKYESVGFECRTPAVASPSEEEMGDCRELFRSRGLNVH